MALPYAKDFKMDHEQRANVAAQADSERAAKIIRSIKQLDADASLLIGPLSERMMGEAVQAVSKQAAAPWQVEEGDCSVLVVCPEWKMTRGVGFGDAWLELTEIGPDEVEGFSWVSVAVGVGQTRLGLELVFRRGLQDVAGTAISDDKLVAPLLKLGMVRHEASPRIFFPIDIQAELLAQGFDTNDLNKALAPVVLATKTALAAKTDLNRLVDHVRAAAARK